MRSLYKYLIASVLFIAIICVSVLAFMNVVSFKKIATLFYINKTEMSTNFSNGKGGGTHTFFYNDITSIQVDFLTLDNSFQVKVNGISIHQNNLELELEELNEGDVHLIFASDGSEVIAPWIANKNNLPRLRLRINHLGEVSMEGTRDIHATTLEKIQLSDQSKFNIIDVFKEQTIITITNIDERGLDGMNGKISITEDRTIHEHKTKAI